jgi:hypothetical protein
LFAKFFRYRDGPRMVPISSATQRLVNKSMWSRIVNRSHRVFAAPARALASFARASGRKNNNSDSARTPGQTVTKRAKIHRVYFVLAFFEVVAVAIGLYVNSRLNHAFTRAVQINLSANKRLLDIEAVRESAKAVIAPSYNVFHSKDARHESALFERSVAASARKIKEFKASVLNFSSINQSEVKSGALRRVNAIETALQGMISTKGFGTGLGLPAVEKILEQHGGGLRIKSTLGAGATFTAWFPRAQDQRIAA